ncbi:4-carboxymuconolactone decarboxylase [Sphaerotilus hippei]|uniref:4-carboxymuconolactone decarboxylase n=1 Tax=Sphaerotilus hippei TaxID=744406 RepID=A0A318H9H6_9BURK|nr:carboxymuconolactone decarboxylase family protein [Sphaerotilus hippei]PXW95000.1 4-carboxymuconolactone decarboxylase [Sphaerotilus hippei]
MTDTTAPTPEPAARHPGEQRRRQVMGDTFVDRALAQADDFSRPLQAHVSEHAWGSTWLRDGLELRQRSLCTVAMLAAMGRSQELKGHLRGAMNNGATLREIREVLLHVAPYAGAPAAIEAFRAAREWMADNGLSFDEHQD